MTKENEVVEIYADGSCLGNPGPGGYAAVMVLADGTVTVTGSEPKTTNNRMELMAVLKALEAAPADAPITVYCDSEYVVLGITDRIHEWMARFWKTAGKKPVKNRQLWEELHLLDDALVVTWKLVKAHDGHVMNDKVDGLAKEAARDQTPHQVVRELTPRPEGVLPNGIMMFTGIPIPPPTRRGRKPASALQ